jgi:hypothetical protein
MPLRPPAGFVSSFYDPLKNPNAPTIGTATAGNAQASVTFTAPSNVGGSAITNYYAVSNPGQITASSVTSPVTVTGLTNGTSYTFTVWALNSFGPSAYSAASGSVTPSPPYIEDVFSTWLYTGNGSSLTVTNGIDLSGNGGMVWVKSRNNAGNNALTDTARGAGNTLVSDSTSANAAQGSNGLSFNSNGFTVGADGWFNNNWNYASWTFRKQPKFFDVVTYTGNGANNRQISHNLGSTPGCIIIKNVSVTTNWAVWHRSVNTSRGVLNLTNAFTTTNAAFYFGDGTSVVQPTSTNFTIGEDGDVNNSGNTFVAYLFAHDAGGFGSAGADNVISCGSYTGNGSSSGPTITLGYEPQWVLIKQATSAGTRWTITDNMRGFPVASSGQKILQPNTTNADIGVMYIQPTSTGFRVVDIDADVNTNGSTYIYIAIRRGPMKTPTTGTSVFSPYITTSVAASASGSTLANALYSTNFVVDMGLQVNASGTDGWYMGPRLAGNRYMKTETTAAEVASSQLVYDSNVGAWGFNGSYGLYSFQRAPGFFDVVCYTGTGANATQAHNLGAVPELIIIKSRTSSTDDWPVSSQFTASTYLRNYLDLNISATTRNYSSSTGFYAQPTSTNIYLDSAGEVNASGGGFVAYLFASCPGVSKVGSYTGTGALQTINCGFTGGARFVLIKRTDSTGDWWVYDSARGITSGNDPYMFLNVAAAEVTGTNYVDTTSVGFQVTAAAPAGLNANGGTYIFLAIA